MYIELEEKGQVLYDLLAEIPPNLVSGEEFLRRERLEADVVTKVAINYSDLCFCELGFHAKEQGLPHTADIFPGMHSTYICEVVKLLLRYGLEPNGIYKDCNIMENLMYLDNEFLGADALSLLLEHGGRYDLTVCGEELFRSVDFNVFFDAIEQNHRQQYTALVHCWMVLIGYGARCGEDKMQVFKEYDSSEYFDLQKLKNHRNYYFGLTHINNDYAVSIYDKDTLWEVARIK